MTEQRDVAGTLLYAVDESPPWWMAIFLALQHVLTMFSGVVIVPTIVAKGTDVSAEQLEFVAFASILVASVSTFIQVVRVGKVGAGYVLFMGTSGAFIACSLTAVKLGGFALLATMSMLAAPLELLLSYFLRFLRHIITPAVGGVVIMLVVVSVMPIALNLWVGAPQTAAHGSVTNLLVGLLTAAVILGGAIFGGARFRPWSPIVGILFGYLAAGFAGILDLTHFHAAALFGLPRGHWTGIAWTLSSSHLPLLITFGMATLAGTIESVGDAMAVQKVSERQFTKVDYDSVQGCLYADGIGNFLAGLAGTVPNTTYSGNIAMLELTGVASRRVGIWGAILLALLAFFPKFSALIIDIPGPVIGAALTIFMSTLFATGIKVATVSGINYQSTIIVGVAFLVGFVMESQRFFPALIPPALAPLLGNGITTGGLTAFILSLLFYVKPHARMTFRLAADTSLLPSLHEFAQEVSAAFRMTEKQMLALQLSCEEVFMHLCGSHPESDDHAAVRFQFSHADGAIHVEVTDRSLASDVDMPHLPADLGKAEASELAQLGLVLLNKVANDVTHLRISGFNYISFTIPGA